MSPEPMDCDPITAPIDKLNSDALQLVFEALLSPPGLLNISTQSMLDRPWVLQLRELKTLVLVCKRWSVLGRRYLYRDICLRYVGQIPALVRTIRDAPDTFAPLVGRLRVICYIPEEYMRVCAEGLQYLLDTCPLLHEVAFEEFAAVEGTFFTLRDMLAQQFPRLPRTLQKLRLFSRWTDLSGQRGYDLAQVPIPLKLLNSLPNLLALEMNAFTPHEYQKHVSLPSLRSLRVHIATTFDLPDTWDLPSLIHFSMRARMSRAGEAPMASTLTSTGLTKCTNAKQFFDAHGHNLTHVDLGCTDMTWPTVKLVVDRCPLLDHLVLTIPESQLEDSEPIRRVSYIDIFKRPVATAARRAVPKWALAMLSAADNHIRLLDRALLSFVPDLPTLFPPEESAAFGVEETRTIEYYGLTIRQSPDAIWLATLMPDDEYPESFYHWADAHDARGDSDADSVRSENTEEEFDRVSTWSDNLDSDEETDTSYVSGMDDSDDEDYVMGDEDGASDEEEDIVAEAEALLDDQTAYRREFLPRALQAIQIDEEEALRRFYATLENE
ncbi:hypothetical protein BC629DRAFT_320651 [Irpex lacteus]|nr:hypothetical protein BC629DRAFT_320651 [Irpex lacteus]